MLVGHFKSGMMKTHDRGVEVQVAVNRDGIFDILGEAKFQGKEHEHLGELVIELAMPLPVFPVCEVFVTTV